MKAFQSNASSQVNDTESEALKSKKKKIPMFGGSSAKRCPKCNLRIYPTDAKLAMGDAVYHKTCSKCEVCKGQLTIKNFATSGDKACFAEHFMEEFASSGDLMEGTTDLSMRLEVTELHREH